MRHRHPWKSGVFRHLFAVAEGMLWVLAGGLALAGLILFLGNPPPWLLTGAAHFLWSLGAFFAGRRSGFHGRHHGLADGMLCGALLGAVLLCGNAVQGAELSGSVAFRLLLMLLAGAAGGVLGVNKKLKRSPD